MKRLLLFFICTLTLFSMGWAADITETFGVNNGFPSGSSNVPSTESPYTSTSSGITYKVLGCYNNVQANGYLMVNSKNYDAYLSWTLPINCKQIQITTSSGTSVKCKVTVYANNTAIATDLALDKTSETFTVNVPEAYQNAGTEYKILSPKSNGANIQFSTLKYVEAVGGPTDAQLSFSTPLSVEVGETLDLSSYVTSAGGYSGSYDFSITNGSSFATLNGSTLSANAAGTVTVKAAIPASNTQYTGEVTADVTITPAQGGGNQGGDSYKQVTATVIMNNQSDLTYSSGKTITWTSSDDKYSFNTSATSTGQSYPVKSSSNLRVYNSNGNIITVNAPENCYFVSLSAVTNNPIGIKSGTQTNETTLTSESTYNFENNITSFELTSVKGSSNNKNTDITSITFVLSVPDSGSDPEPEPIVYNAPFNGKTYTLTDGDTNAKITDWDDSHPTFTFSYSPAGIITIDSNGAITNTGTGTVSVTATWEGDDTWKEGSATFTVVVNEKPTVDPDPEQPLGNTWKKVISEDELTLDGQYLVVSGSSAMGWDNNNGKNSYLPSETVEVIDNTVTTTGTENYAVVTFEGSDRTAVKVKISDLNGSSKGYYTTTTAKSMSLGTTGTSASVSYTDKGNVEIDFGQTPGKLYYNSSSPRFLNYTSSQTAIDLYKRQPATEGPVDYTAPFDGIDYTLTIGDTNKSIDMNVNHPSFSFSYDPENIVTINEEGVITTIGTGKTTVTATWKGDDTWNEGKAKFTVTVNEVGALPEGDIYVLVTDLSDIEKDNDYIFVVNTGDKYLAMGGLSGTKFSPVEIQGFEDKVVVNEENVSILNPEVIDGKYEWLNNGKYFSGSNSSNLSLNNSSGTYTKWDVSISDDNTALISCTDNRWVIYFNNVFGNYAKQSTPFYYPSIYRKYEGNLTEADLQFEEDVVTTQISKNYKGQQAISQNGSTGKVTYSSSRPAVAEIENAENYEITVKAIGKTEITANIEATEEFNADHAHYTLIVAPEDGQILSVSETLTALENGYEGEATVKGIVTVVGTPSNTGELTYTIKDLDDESKTIEVYNGLKKDQEEFEDGNLLVGDEVVVKGTLEKYQEDPQIIDSELIEHNYEVEVEIYFDPDNDEVEQNTSFTLPKIQVKDGDRIEVDEVRAAIVYNITSDEAGIATLGDEGKSVTFDTSKVGTVTISATIVSDLYEAADDATFTLTVYEPAEGDDTYHAPTPGDKYELINNARYLVEDCYYVIAYTEGQIAMSNQPTSSALGSEPVKIEGNVLTATENTLVFRLSKDDEGKFLWNFVNYKGQNNSKGISASSSGAAINVTNPEATNVTFKGNDAVISFVSRENNLITYNETNHFRNYASTTATQSGYHAVQIYRLSEPVINVYLVGDMTKVKDPVTGKDVDSEANPSFKFIENNDGESYTLEVASIKAGEKFLVKYDAVKYTFTDYDVEAGSYNTQLPEYTLVKGEEMMKFNDSYINLVFTYWPGTNTLSIDGIKDVEESWIVSYGNDKTLQSGKYEDDIHIIAVAPTNENGEVDFEHGTYKALLYIYAPNSGERVFCNINHTDPMNIRAYADDELTYDELTQHADGYYPVSLNEGQGTISLYTTDQDGNNKANETTINYSVTRDTPVGVDAIGVEDADAEYYTLQGIKVQNPEKGIYIKVQNGKSIKVVL